MLRKLLIFVGSMLLVVAASGFVLAQQQYPIIWEDHFEDDDSLALKNVGWIYYPEQDVQGQVIRQKDGELFIEAGTYGGLVGVGLVATNGLPEITLDEDGNIDSSTVQLALQNKWGDPNQLLTFKVRFARFTTSAFVVGTRMPIDSSRGDSDPTEAPAYALMISPLENTVLIGRYDEAMQVLSPDTWSYFAQGSFEFDLEVDYWVQFYLNGGDLKVKVWEGELGDEPAEWLAEGVDPEPRVTGKFTMFASMGSPPQPGQGDQFYLDDIVMRGLSPRESDIGWEDHFEDAEDTLALKNVGWIYYPEQDVQGQVVRQKDGELFIEAGSYGGLVGVGLVATNGLPEITLDEDGNIDSSTVQLALQNKWSDPNQLLTFKVRFARFTTSAFVVGTRMPIDSSRGDSDPTEAPAYALMISPLENTVLIGRYDEAMQVLSPDTWSYFAQGSFEFDLEVDYWVQFYLNEGDLKVKVWEGELGDEPAEWLAEGVDPEPRVTGKFTMFASMGSPPQPGQGDQFYLDDIVLKKLSTTAVRSEPEVILPTKFDLEQNYPNPFNPNTSISFSLTEKNHTKLVIYNTMGQVVNTLIDADMLPGSHKIVWNGLDGNHHPVTSGIYFYRLTSGKQSVTKRMILMK